MHDHDHDRPPQVITLRTLSACPDRVTCPGFYRLAGRPGIYQIGKRVNDSAEIAALAPHTGADEVVTWAPDELYRDLYPEV